MEKRDFLPNHEVILPALKRLLAEVKKTIVYGPHTIQAEIAMAGPSRNGECRIGFSVEGLRLNITLSDEHAKWLLVALNDSYRLFHFETESGSPDDLPEKPNS